MKTTLHACLLATTAFLSTPSIAQIPDIYNPYTGNPLDQAQGFNLITKTNFTVKGGQIAGPVAVGGDMKLNGNASIATSHSGFFPSSKNNDNSNYSLIVGGRLDFTGGGTSTVTKGFVKLTNPSGARLFDKNCSGANVNLRIRPTSGGACNSEFNNNRGVELQRQQTATSVTSAHGMDFTAAYTWFTQLSQAISYYGATYIPITEIVKLSMPATTNPKITLTKDKINFIQMTAAQLTTLANQGTLSFTGTPSSSTPVVFNVLVPSTGYTWTPPVISGLADSANHYIVWHIASTVNGFNLTINGNNTIPGTVLAPMANVSKTTSSIFNGQLIANSAVMDAGQVNYYPFLGRMATFAPTPLAVKLVSFNGHINANKGNLQWNVAQNEEGAYFEVEKSADGRNFSSIGRVYSTGKTGNETYAYTDASGSLGYYRLKMVSKNAFPSYSGIIRLQAEEGLSLLAELLQNPVISTLPLRLTTAKQGVATIQVYALSGAKMMSRNVLVQKGSNSVTLKLESSLPNGTYLVEVLVNGERSTLKLVK